MLRQMRRAALLAAFTVAIGLGVGGRATSVGAATPTHAETAVLAGGCFWGMEEIFSSLRGVTNVTVGFSGGDAATAHYETVSEGDTGHAESVKIAFDPQRISYAQLLQVYFKVAHDPTQLNQQAPDVGTQYRSEIFYQSDAQRRTALTTIAELNQKHVFHAPIVTKVEKLHGFYAAEAYHQHFAERHPDNPYIVSVDQPRMERLRQMFPNLLKY